MAVKEINNSGREFELTLEDKVELTESIYIGYPRFDALLKKIKFCHEYSCVSAEPECLLVTGPTGAGKTTLLKQYARKFPREVTETRTKVPVLIATIPSPATHKSMVQKLLFELDDPAPGTGTTTSALTIRLYNFLKDCGVELIVLDELQHFIDRDSLKVLQTVSDWLKTLLVDTKIPIVLLGLPESENVINANPQLSRRFAHRHSLEPFSFDTQEKMDEFRKFLFALDKQLPFQEHSGLSAVDMAARIYYATDGVVGYVMKLIRKATYLGLLQGRQKLDMDVLAEAFEQHIHSDKPIKNYNPFTEDCSLNKEAKDEIFSNKTNNSNGKENKTKGVGNKAANRRMNAKKPKKEKFSDR